MKCIDGHISLVTHKGSGTLGVVPTISGSVQKTTTDMEGSLERRRLSGSISVVCSLPRFVVVKPEIIWLTEANSFRMDVDVISNTDWTIE